jgi:hypothetical protein
MTFLELQQYLEESIRTMPPGVDVPVTYDWLESLSERDTYEADLVCVSIAYRKAMSAIPSSVRRQVFARLTFACERIERMIVEVPGCEVPPECSAEELLVDALVLRWREEWREWFLAISSLPLPP